MLARNGEAVDGFEDISPWTTAGGSISATNDAYRGDQAMHIGSPGTWNEIYRDFGGLDFTASGASMAVKPVPLNGSIRITLVGANDVTMRTQWETDKQPADEWVRFDFGASQETGVLDMSNVTRAYIKFTGEVVVDDFRLTRSPYMEGDGGTNVDVRRR